MNEKKWIRPWLTGVVLFASLEIPQVVGADAECHETNILLKSGPPPETCAFDVCGTSTSSAGLGPGIWQTGLNLTDVAPPVAPVPDEFVLTGTFTLNFVAADGDVFLGHSVFVAAPARPNVSGALYFLKGGTGKFIDASAVFVDIKQRDESTVRLVGQLCGLPVQHFDMD